MAALPETAEPIEDVAAEAPQDTKWTTDQTETPTAAKATSAAKDGGAATKKKKKGKK